MKSGNKIWSTVVDYFLMLGAIIGVGFASGKEIYVFFFQFGQSSFLGLLSFGLLYVVLFFIIQYFSNKIQTNNYDEFNKKIFGKFCSTTKIFLLINFLITASGMFAGADYLFKKFFNVGYMIPSLILGILTFIILLGGIEKIKIVSNLIIPIMLLVIVINSFLNITPQNVNFQVVKNSGLMSIYYGVLFGVNNFVTALPVVFETKLKTKGNVFVTLTICVVILLNLFVLSSNNFSTDMPMFELSAVGGKWFYYIYFSILILALFSTLEICVYNAYNILDVNKKSKFILLFTILLTMLLSRVGYAFIVKYLYVVSGIISGIYLILMLIKIICILLKRKMELIKIKRKKN